MIISNVQPGFTITAETDLEGYKSSFSRAKTLLRATYELLKAQRDSPYVLNILEQTAIWDEAECDGSCLMDDIRYWFDEFTTEELPE